MGITLGKVLPNNYFGQNIDDEHSVVADSHLPREKSHGRAKEASGVIHCVNWGTFTGMRRREQNSCSPRAHF
jgi:hypothetical protein